MNEQYSEKPPAEIAPEQPLRKNLELARKDSDYRDELVFVISQEIMRAGHKENPEVVKRRVAELLTMDPAELEKKMREVKEKEDAQKE